ncbi:hypothetical protein EG237_00725 [Escherichia coli]|nr:hypothetical protein [Escherichia coli]EFA4678316.1 hypothetical protein [Escherichia coli]RZW03002.1 hypothetical protein EXX81_08750 [Escherichia coli]
MRFSRQYSKERQSPYSLSLKQITVLINRLYQNDLGLRLQINRIDSGLNVRIADLDYYWLQERGSMCQPTYMVLDRSQ